MYIYIYISIYIYIYISIVVDCYCLLFGYFLVLLASATAFLLPQIIEGSAGADDLEAFFLPSHRAFTQRMLTGSRYFILSNSHSIILNMLPPDSNHYEYIYIYTHMLYIHTCIYITHDTQCLLIAYCLPRPMT